MITLTHNTYSFLVLRSLLKKIYWIILIATLVLYNSQSDPSLDFKKENVWLLFAKRNLKCKELYSIEINCIIIVVTLHTSMKFSYDTKIH